KGLDDFLIDFTRLKDFYIKFGAIYLDNLARGSFDTPVRELYNMFPQQLSVWSGSSAVLKEDILPPKDIIKKYTVAIMAGTVKSAQNLADELVGDGYSASAFNRMPDTLQRGRISVLPGSLSASLEYTNIGFLLITQGRANEKKPKSVRQAKKLKNAFHSLDALHRGDYVVQSTHGIGVFEGIKCLTVSGLTKDYIKIKYAKGDILYVPVTQLDTVAKYVGPRDDSRTVRLNRIGGKEWENSKSRVKSAVKDMAKELIELYSKRTRSPGYAFSRDIDMQNDFERRFPFDETDDQLRCIDEIKRDMEKTYPMDRLLCGDVGFGKTEVALRAAFKCVADGKQCAILVPTTILAFQHYQTILKRLEGFPVEIEMLSRFKTALAQKNIVTKLRRGGIDIVVGTHRLISKDVQFRDLGLLVVDEEQRFGVAQKEKIKELFPNVDVLTLSATPIPRTLNMAMSGIRDMSIIEEAPQDRFPVQSYVLEYDTGVIVHAIEKELRRGGQVYYMHNKIETISQTANMLSDMLPDARIGIAHGRMDEDSLSDVWRKLLECEIDILVCTTIIETGVDVPNVNTLIIENADALGLAQLHQIRGRIGRSSRRASAYFTFKRGKNISEIATRRLSAIREYTEFGAGFKIAMRDLELRGAGNVLGAQQHGHMEAVGYDMYIKLLNEAVSEEKDVKPAKKERECLIDIQIDAHIPDAYIDSLPQRLAIYRRIADIRTKEDALDVADEITDRFGDPPDSVTGLIDVSLLRNTAASLNIYEIAQNADNLILYIDSLDMKAVSKLSQVMKGRILVSAGSKPYISVKIPAAHKPLKILTEVFDVMTKN
ncbi:MAG: transcription-repair coupling factor, partial [Oscillospiraceae bacterium]|nr:transcription-repair coupling factor [Oscillospiraceae bacterium]